MPNFSGFRRQISDFLKTFKESIKITWTTNPKQATVVFATSAIQGLLRFPTILIYQLALDQIVQAVSSGLIQPYLNRIILIVIVKKIIDYSNGLLDDINFAYAQNLSRQITTAVSLKISSKLNSISVATAESPDIKNKFQNMSDNTGRNIWGFVMPLSGMLQTFFNIISTGIFIYRFEPLILIPAALIAIPEIIVGTQKSKTEHEFQNRNSLVWRVYYAFDDLITKGRYLYENKILGHVDTMLKERTRVVQNVLVEDLEISKKFYKKKQLVNIPHASFIGAVQIWVYYQAIIQKITIGSAQAVANSLDGFVSNFSWLIRSCANLYQSHLFVEDYIKFMELDKEIDPGKEMLEKKITTGIEFKNVWFRYPSSNRWILKDVSFSIEPSDNLAIVGVNGAGKSTLIKLICRFYEPNKGEIFLGGKNITEYSLKSYRFAIAALFQDFAQYPFSAKVNVSYGDVRKKSLISKVRKSAKLADIDDFLISLPLGYKTPLDKEFKDGVEPSKGQWQRVALARALYRNSALIILDEPTSNVDPETEEIIFDRILKVASNKCVILVSHRFSTVKRADKILVLEDGLVKEIGSHSQLMKNHGSYHRLYSLQAKSYQS